MPLFTKNVELARPLKLSPWRKVAIGTWRTAGDPSIYGMMDFDVEPALAYVEKARQRSGDKVTLTHFIGRAVAVAVSRNPEINCILRWGRLYPRVNVDAFFMVASDMEGKDLSGSVVRQADRKSMTSIARELNERVETIRAKGDPAFKKMKGTMGLLPGWATRYAIDFAGFLTYLLNIWTPLLGSPRDPFGSFMVTSIGSLGLEMAFAPLVPYSRCPLVLAVGAVKENPVVRDGKLAVAKQIRVCATFDHRLIDGVQAARLAKSIVAIMNDPEKELGEP
jgi:pyruvate/2-oxoglutarate dehydrogenase complex dihydrolipoamide acyltransferase (E2) component